MSRGTRFTIFVKKRDEVIFNEFLKKCEHKKVSENVCKLINDYMKYMKEE